MKPGIYLVNASGEMCDLATEGGGGDRKLLKEVLDLQGLLDALKLSEQDVRDAMEPIRVHGSTYSSASGHLNSLVARQLHEHLDEELYPGYDEERGSR